MSMVRRLSVVCLFVAVSAFAQSADQEVVSVVDAPDPVVPGNTLTYTITLRNNGPDAAVNGGLNVNLPAAVTYQNTVAPAGFTCTPFGSSVTCSTPSFAAGTTVVFTMTVQVSPSLINFADGTFSANFSPSGTTPDPNTSNNSKSATTTYDSPQIDMSVAVSDAPDPVAPDGNITYTVDVANGGPDTATSASLSAFNSGTLLFQSATVPAGWSCTLPAVNGGVIFSCTSAAMLGGTTSQFQFVVKAPKSTIGVNDTTVATNFSASATGNDTNNGNNSETETTTYDAPSVDMAITASDSPDPVAPDGNITYTVTVTNNGPDAASNAAMSVALNNTLLYQSITIPAGWTCPPLSPGHGAGFTCTAATMASGTAAVFTVVLKAAQSQIGINDTTLNQLFTASNEWRDPNNSNNAVTVQTAYHAPHADMAVTASDSPDPVVPDGNITYTVTVTNSGPDAATNAGMSVLLNNTLLYQSITVPAGWTCPPLSPGNGAGFTCTASTFAASATATFTVVLKAARSQIGNHDTTLNELFSVSAAEADPNNANNAVTVQTQYDAPNVDLAVTASDSPDPVAPDGNITYTVNVTNNGPDAATNGALSVVNNNLKFQSITVPAGWTCPPLTVGQGAAFTCSATTFAASAASTFTIVVKAAQSQFGNGNQTINEVFVISSDDADTNNANNSVTVPTQYVAPQADLVTTNADSPDPVVSGANITYAQSLTNNGPDAAATVVFSETLPSSAGFVSITVPAGFSCTTPAVGASGAISCSAATLANGATANFTVVAKALAPSGTVSVTTTASSAANDPNGANTAATATTTINGPTGADLAVTTSTGATSAVIGANLTYTVVLTNNGPDAATGVVLTDALPSSLLFQSITAPAGFACTTPAAGASGTITCNAATLGSGGSATFMLTVRVADTASGTVANSASATSAVSDPNGGNSSGSSASLAVASSADLSITKTTTATQAPTNSVINYTIAVSNAGPSPATGVVVTDVLPSGLQFVSATPSQGPCSGTTNVTCNLGTIASGGSATVVLSARVIATTGSIANTASVSSASTDPGGSNNSGAAAAVAVAAAGASIPTLSEWALIALAGVLAALAMLRMQA